MLSIGDISVANQFNQNVLSVKCADLSHSKNPANPSYFTNH